MKREEKKQIFVMAHDRKIVARLLRGLERYRCNVTFVYDFDSIVDMAQSARMDAIVIGYDIENRLQLASRIYNTDRSITLVLLCENKQQLLDLKDRPYNTIALLEPFTVKYLNTLINESKIRPMPDAVFELGDYVFDYNTKSLIYARGTEYEREVKLMKKENEILFILAQHPDTIVLRSKFLNNIWKGENFNLSRSMDVYITYLRARLNLDSSLKIINVHAIGFMLKTK